MTVSCRNYFFRKTCGHLVPVALGKIIDKTFQTYIFTFGMTVMTVSCRNYFVRKTCGHLVPVALGKIIDKTFQTYIFTFGFAACHLLDSNYGCVWQKFSRM